MKDINDTLRYGGEWKQIRGGLLLHTSHGFIAGDICARSATAALLDPDGPGPIEMDWEDIRELHTALGEFIEAERESWKSPTQKRLEAEGKL